MHDDEIRDAYTNVEIDILLGTACKTGQFAGYSSLTGLVIGQNMKPKYGAMYSFFCVNLKHILQWKKSSKFEQRQWTVQGQWWDNALWAWRSQIAFDFE